MDIRDEVKAFLSSRRARITPEQAGLTTYNRNRRVPGLRRSEVADLAGVSVEYYAELERGNLAGDSDSVLDASPGPCNSTKPNSSIWPPWPVPPALPAAPAANHPQRRSARASHASST